MGTGIHRTDPREGTYPGNDVGRKLLMLARELDLSNEFFRYSKVENLISESPSRVGESKAFWRQLIF